MSEQRERKIDWPQNFVDSIRLMINIGADAGIYTSRLSGLARKAHAFESNPELTGIIEFARLDNVDDIDQF